MTRPGWVQRVEAPLAGSGLFVRGAFHPAPGDEVPALADGRPARTVVLIGNAGNALWQAFRAGSPDMDARHPLDRWVAGYLQAAADALALEGGGGDDAGRGAEALDAMTPPWPPIQRWAVRAGAGHRSPINLLVHPEYGLWHTFRGALLGAAALALPPASAPENPCEACADKPCLTGCPAGAFVLPAGGRFAALDSAICVDHVEGPAGRGCRTAGCLARRACPVGRSWAYRREPAAYHMAAVVRTVRRQQAAGALPRAADRP